MFWAESLQYNSPLFNRVAGQVEVLVGQVNYRGSLPCSASNILEPILHPALQIIGLKRGKEIVCIEVGQNRFIQNSMWRLEFFVNFAATFCNFQKFGHQMTVLT